MTESRYIPFVYKGPREPDPERCAASVSEGFWRYQCSRKVSVTEAGYGWCRQHAPSAVKARCEARDRRYRAEMDWRKARWNVESAKADVAEVAIKVFRQQASLDDLEAAVAEYERADAMLAERETDDG